MVEQRDSPERRHNVRHSLERFLLVRFGSTRQLRRTYVRDISRGGMFVRTRHPRAMRDHLQVVLELPDGTRLPLQGEITYCVTPQQARRPGDAGVGVRFLDLNDTTAFLLEEYISLHQGEALSPPPGPLPVDPALATDEPAPVEPGSVALLDHGDAPMEVSRVSSLVMLEPPTREFAIPREISGAPPAPRPPPLPPPPPPLAPPLAAAPPPTPEQQRELLEVTLLLDEEVHLLESSAHGTAYDLLGLEMSATQDGVAAAYAERLAEIDAGALHGRIPYYLRERLDRMRAALDAALEVLSSPASRAQLDLRLEENLPAGRSDAEMEAFRAELAFRRESASPEQQADYALARPFAEAARREAAVGRALGARGLLRAALLHDPYNLELRQLLAAIESLRP